MPTGYTDAIKDGIDFPTFAMRCARNFGATIEMRDEPLDAPIPERFEVSDYHLKALKHAREEQKRLSKLSDEECEAEALASFTDAKRDYLDSIKEKQATEAAYRAMLEKVRQWQPPTPDHEGLKAFMVEQIEQSIKHDCATDYLVPPHARTGQEWVNLCMSQQARDIEYHGDHYDEDLQRARDRSEWVKALRESLR